MVRQDMNGFSSFLFEKVSGSRRPEPVSTPFADTDPVTLRHHGDFADVKGTVIRQSGY